MKLETTVAYVLLFGCATRVLPFRKRQWSCWNRSKFFYRLAKIYAIFMLTFNAACNLDVNLSPASLYDLTLAMRLYYGRDLLRRLLCRLLDPFVRTCSSQKDFNAVPTFTLHSRLHLKNVRANIRPSQLPSMQVIVRLRCLYNDCPGPVRGNA